MIHPIPDGPLEDPLSTRAAAELNIYGVHLQVDTVQLRHLARALDGVADHLRQALSLTSRAGAGVDVTIAHAPGSGRRAMSATWAAYANRTALPASVGQMAADVRTAAWRYLDAELAAQQHLVLPRATMPGPVCVAPPQRQPLTNQVLTLHFLRYPGRLIGAAMGTVLESLIHGRLTPSDAQTGFFLAEATSILDVGGILQGASSVHVFSALINRVTTAGISTRVKVEQVPPPAVVRPSGTARRRGSTHPAPTTDLRGLVRNIGDLYPQYGAPPNSVRVDRLVGPDGSVSWQVFVPGTQSAQGLWGGDSPNDWASNAQLHGRQDSAASAAVIAAMRAAGVGAGEPVLIAGHSQGGMVAADLAAREDVRAEFSIASVLSVGAPVGHIDIPADVATLHLEHTDDLVSGLDDQINPVSPHRTSVTRNVTAASPWYVIGHVGQSHDIPAYEETARLVDASTDPAVRNWFAASATMLDTRAQVTSTYIRATRV